jgi:hypothetical protein
VTAAALNQRLRYGLEAGGIDLLADRWRHDEIEVRLTGMAAFAGSASLLNKVRGALGAVLLAAGSPGVRRRAGCDWLRTCAAEVFFGRRQAVRIGDHDSELTKPFVLRAERQSNDLVVGIRVFGIAREWSPAVADALVVGLRHNVRWDDLARDGAWRAPPKIQIAAVRQLTNVATSKVEELPGRAIITFLSPSDVERGQSGILQQIARRLALLAPWHGVEADLVHRELLAALIDNEVRESDPSSAPAFTLGGGSCG